MTARAVDLAALEREGERLGATLASGSVVWLEARSGRGRPPSRAPLCGAGAFPTKRRRRPTPWCITTPARAATSITSTAIAPRHPDDAADLDWETLAGADLLLIEWPERAGRWAPPPTHRITLDYGGGDARRMELA